MSSPGAGSTAALAGTVVFAACLAVIYATPGDAYWISDCGNKALLAQRMLDTRYAEASFDHPGARYDPLGAWFPIPRPFALPRAGRFRSAYPPAYSALAAPALGVFGPRGLRLPAALGVAASAALFVLWAAPAVGRRWALAGALVLGVASPLFFYGVTVWEHGLTVALALGAWLLLAGGGAWRAAAAGLLVGAACWLREELVLMWFALLLAAAWERRSRACWLALAAGGAAPLVALLLFNHWFFGNPLGAHVLANLVAGPDPAALGPRGEVSPLMPVPGLLGGFGRSPLELWAFGLLGVGLPLLGWLLAWRAGVHSSLRSWLPLALASASALPWLLGFARMASAASPLQALVQHNGLLLQWPMLGLAGVGLWLAWRSDAYTTLRSGVFAGLVFAASVVAIGMLAPSDYGAQTGAGVHWGPRLLLPALPVLVLLAVAAARGDVAETSRPRTLAWVGLAFAGLLSTGMASWMLAEQKGDAAAFMQRLRGLEPRYVLTPHPFLAQHLTALWDEKPMLLVPSAQALDAATGALQRGGAREFLYVAPPGPAPPQLADFACRRSFAHRGRLHYVDLDVQRCALRAARASRVP